MGRASDDNSKPEDIVGEYIKTIAKTRQSMDVPDPDHAKLIRYLFVDLKVDQYGSDPSRIIEITYNTQMIQDALNNLLLYHLLVGILALCIGCGGAFVLSRYLTRPIREIVEDVNTIADGNLDHRIGHTESLEFEVLEQNINSMVDTIQASLLELNNRKLLQKNIIDHLPVAVAMKDVESGRYVYWNKVSELFYGLDAEDVIGKTDQEIFSEEQVIYKQNEERAAILKGKGISSITMLDALFTGRIIKKIHVPIFDSEGTLCFLLVIVENLDDENLNVKLDLLFSVTRRDILDQLAVIISYLERAQLKATPDSMQMFFQKTLESVEAIQNQLEFVRTLQGIGIGCPKWQSIKKAFNDGIHLLPKHEHIDIRFDMDDIEVYADPFLPWIVYSILNNSLSYGGDNLTMIRLRSLFTPEKLLLVYEDNGAGIPPDEKEKLFEFIDGSGSNPNLYLIRELLGFTGITIEETGDPESGIRFEISIPKGAFRPVSQEET
jgi:signal transduction histidine kinase/HAMP domain-containing protein